MVSLNVNETRHLVITKDMDLIKTNEGEKMKGCVLAKEEYLF